MTILIVALALWAAGILVLPVTIWRDSLSVNARNLPGLIVMRRGLPVPGSVWAQEYYEARQAWRLLPLHPVLILVGRIYPPWAAYERQREAMGHEVEVWAEAALTGAPVDALRRREARGLSEYPAFSGHTAGAVEALMAQCTGDAQAFVSKHMGKIKAVRDEPLG